MKTIWILIFVIATFWLTLFLSNAEMAKKETPGNTSQHAVIGYPSNLVKGLDGSIQSSFVFRTLSEKHDQIQIVLGMGSFKSNEANRFHEKLQDLEASNINLRNI